ncbi:MAG: hypothetical protein AAB877_00820 [Patescibacteria group bacterium]
MAYRKFLTHEQQLIVRFILDSKRVEPDYRLMAANLILNDCDESQLAKIKEQVGKSDGSPAEREAVINEILAMEPQSLAGGVD